MTNKNKTLGKTIGKRPPKWEGAPPYGASPPKSPGNRSPPLFHHKDLKIRERRWQRKHRLKSEFAFIQSSSRQFQLTYFVKCRRTLLELNSWKTISEFRMRKKISSRLFTSSIKREIRHFLVVVVQWRQRNVQKSMMHVQSCCFANLNYYFFEVPVAVAVVGS